MASDQYRLKGIVDVKEEIGKGAYCKVLKLKFRGLTCAGKKIHDFFIQESSPADKESLLRRFSEECELLSSLRHPNIIQFLGIYEKEQGVPILVMEYMAMSLTSLVDDRGPLPSDLATSILKDVALGLAYIHGHTPPIVHRDLTTNNVLLTADLRAKVSDLGVARILNISPNNFAKMTQCPGTPIYMPPEALHDDPVYDIHIDCFSFGVLIVHIISGQWPLPSAPTRINPSSSVLEAVSEFDRRAKYVSDLPPDTPLLVLAKSCLANDSRQRPLMDDILIQLEKCCAPENMDQGKSQHESGKIAALKNELEMTRGKLEVSNADNEKLLLSQSLLQTQLQAQAKEIECSHKEVLNLRESIKNHTTAIEDKELIISMLNEQLSTVQKHLLVKTQLPTIGFEWKKCGELPTGAVFPLILPIGGMVITGGGYSEKSLAATRNLYCSKDLEKWEILHSLPVVLFGLSKMENNLVIALGKNVDTGEVLKSASTLEVYKLQHVTNVFATSFVRTHCGTVAVPPQGIAIIGGISPKKGVLDSCEYVGFDGKWSKLEALPPLPIPLYQPTCLFMNNTLYVAGGYSSFKPAKANNEVFCLNWSTKQWSKLCSVPFSYSCYVLMAGMLLAIGGFAEGKMTKSILMYSVSSKRWVKIGEFPEPLAGASACCVSTGELVVLGGSSLATKENLTVHKGWICI